MLNQLDVQSSAAAPREAGPASQAAHRCWGAGAFCCALKCGHHHPLHPNVPPQSVSRGLPCLLLASSVTRPSRTSTRVCCRCVPACAQPDLLFSPTPFMNLSLCMPSSSPHMCIHTQHAGQLQRVRVRSLNPKP